MTLKETLDAINGILEGQPYSKEEIASIWKEEKDKDWDAETIFAYAAALDYLHRVGKPEAEFLRGKYERLLGELKEKYAAL